MKVKNYNSVRSVVKAVRGLIFQVGIKKNFSWLMFFGVNFLLDTGSK